jgi:alcohol dehydrogenase class IV
MEVNITALKNKNQQKQLLKFVEVARILTKNSSAVAEDGVVWVKELVKKLQIPALSDFHISTDSFPELIEKAKNSSSMKGNPVELDDKQFQEILHKSL